MELRNIWPGFARLTLVIVSVFVVGEANASSTNAGNLDARREMVRISNDATNDVLEERFVDGAKKFQRAYEVFPDPILLKNQMVAWFRAGECGPAITAANAFMQTDEVSVEDAEHVNQVRFTCSMQIAKQSLEIGELELAKHAVMRASQWAQSPEEHGEVARRMRELELRGVKFEPDAEPPAQTEIAYPGVDLPAWPGWTMLATGAAVLGGGIAYYFVSEARETELQEIHARGDASEEARFLALQGQLATAQWLLPTLYAVGGLASVGGVTYLIVRASKNTPSAALEVRFLPPLSPQIPAGVNVRLKF